MNIEDLKLIIELTKKEIDRTMNNEYGTERFTRLCNIQSELSIKIRELEDPERARLIKKLKNPEEFNEK